MFLVNAVAFTIALAIALTIFFRQIYGRFNLLPLGHRDLQARPPRGAG
jgi:hypothetical protein